MKVKVFKYYAEIFVEDNFPLIFKLWVKLKLHGKNYKILNFSENFPLEIQFSPEIILIFFSLQYTSRLASLHVLCKVVVEQCSQS